MRRLLIGSAAIAAAIVATPAAAQIYIGLGQSPYAHSNSPYSYGNSPYGYSPYSNGNSQYSYGYSPYPNSYSPYGYGYSNPQYSYGNSYPSYGPGYSYPSYNYGYPTYGYRSSSRCIRSHHRNGIRYYTRVLLRRSSHSPERPDDALAALFWWSGVAPALPASASHPILPSGFDPLPTLRCQRSATQMPGFGPDELQRHQIGLIRLSELLRARSACRMAPLEDARCNHFSGRCR